MSKNFVQPGNTITITAAAALASGEGVKTGQLFGVVQGAVASGEQAEVSVVGVWELPKKTADVVTAGALLYWDDTNKELTITATGNLLVGAATEAANGTVSLVKCRLNGMARADGA